MTQLPDTTAEQGQREASVMLARLMPDVFTVRGVDAMEPYYQVIYRDKGGFRFHDVNLCDAANLALVWKIVNWASENVPHFSKWWHEIAVVTIQDLPPAALSIFLCDNILRLADEASMIEVNE